MKILTGNSYGKDLEELESRDMGIMIASGPSFPPDKKWPKFYCALDNGAFMCQKKGYPFMPDYFMKTLSKCFELNIPLQMIACPDIVAGGKKSLLFSYGWATSKLIGCPNLALVVQDGMTPNMVGDYIDPFQWIFVGGSVEWKWANLEGWIEYARENGLKVHVGQVGTLPRLRRCKELGVDSVDSTSFVRNKTWNIIDEFYNEGQLRIC